jgi:decaprenylphospho-beta-D-ribofuranose 2-oxidase
MSSDLSFLAYGAAGDTDILQEYFVSVASLPGFLDDLREVVERNRVNLLSATIRYVPRSLESVLSYSRPEASFGVVLYLNVGRGTAQQAETARWTRQLVDRALEKGGTYYLPYRPYATREQFLAAYPRAPELLAKKLRYDPQELFVNTFYRTYLRPEAAGGGAPESRPPPRR